MTHHASGWDEDDPEYVVARIEAVVASMARSWRGHPYPVVEAELARRLRRVDATEWPPELLEHLARRIRDPHWIWKHPRQALDLSRRFRARSRTSDSTRLSR